MKQQKQNNAWARPSLQEKQCQHIFFSHKGLITFYLWTISVDFQATCCFGPPEMNPRIPMWGALNIGCLDGPDKGPPATWGSQHCLFQGLRKCVAKGGQYEVEAAFDQKQRSCIL